MKSLQIYCSLLIAGLFTCSAYGQSLSASVLADYNPNIVAQVFEYTVKTNIGDEEQINIAKLIEERDLRIKDMLLDNRNFKDIDSLRIVYNDQINATFNTEQKYNKYVKTVREGAKDKYTYSQFAIALRFKDTIGISQLQENALMEKIEALKTLKNTHYAQTKQSLDTRAFESEAMTQILSEEQYTKVLNFKNESKARAFAESDWKELVQRNITLDSTYTEERAKQIFFDYYLDRENTYNRYQHDLVMQKAVARDRYYERPVLIRILERARRNPDNDTQNLSYPSSGGN